MLGIGPGCFLRGPGYSIAPRPAVAVAGGCCRPLGMRGVAGLSGTAVFGGLGGRIVANQVIFQILVVVSKYSN